jgi:hypothetical protein
MYRPHHPLITTRPVIGLRNISRRLMASVEEPKSRPRSLCQGAERVSPHRLICYVWPSLCLLLRLWLRFLRAEEMGAAELTAGVGDASLCQRLDWLQALQMNSLFLMSRPDRALSRLTADRPPRTSYCSPACATPPRPLLLHSGLTFLMCGREAAMLSAAAHFMIVPTSLRGSLANSTQAAQHNAHPHSHTSVD